MTNQPCCEENPDCAILFDQYKLYVDSSLKVTEHRNSANTYFLSLNTFLYAGLGVASAAGLGVLQSGWTIFVTTAGIVLCLYWHRLIQSYMQLNRAKFEIIHRLEEQLPAKVFSDEWEALGKGEDPTVYRPLTDLEKIIPWIFGLLYFVLLIWSLLSTFCFQYSA